MKLMRQPTSTISAALFLMLALGHPARSEVMNVRQVKELLDKGQLGELAATSYSQGVVDGLLAMEYLHRTNGGAPKEFCGIIDAHRAGRPITHPAFKTKELVLAWEKQKRPMETLFTDLMLSYMSAQYGCKK